MGKNVVTPIDAGQREPKGFDQADEILKADILLIIRNLL
jgi:hypothetical protein